MFWGIASIPLAYKFAAEYGFGFYSTFILIMMQIIPICVGLFLVYTTLRFKKSAANRIDNAQPGNKQIVITVNDSGVVISSEGMSPQDIIAILELSKYYIVSKNVGFRSSIDVVRRK